MNVVAKTFLIIAWLVVAIGCESPSPGESEQTTKAGMVTVEIDFNGREANKEFKTACAEDSTVFSIMQNAESAGEIKFVFSGKSETAFVSAIDGVENQKSAGDNWTFHVNGKMGDRSCGVFPVKNGDQILWRFGEYP